MEAPRVVVSVEGEEAAELLDRAEDFDMDCAEFLHLCFKVTKSLPDSLVFALAAGVPVTFNAVADVGVQDG